MALIGEVFAGWFGDRNRAIGGNVYALTILLRVKPGRALRLRADIRALRDDSPFAELAGTHFARLVVIDRLAFEGPVQDAPDAGGELLLFTAVVDGAEWDGYLEQLQHARLRPVWEACAGVPAAGDTHAFTGWLLANRRTPNAFYFHYDATVGQAQEALELRERVREFALANKYVTPKALRESFRAEFKP
jgi:hypothetical protein